MLLLSLFLDIICLTEAYTLTSLRNQPDGEEGEQQDKRCNMTAVHGAAEERDRGGDGSASAKPERTAAQLSLQKFAELKKCRFSPREVIVK